MFLLFGVLIVALGRLGQLCPLEGRWLLGALQKEHTQERSPWAEGVGQ